MDHVRHFPLFLNKNSHFPPFVMLTGLKRMTDKFKTSLMLLFNYCSFDNNSISIKIHVQYCTVVGLNFNDAFWYFQRLLSSY